MCRGVHGAVRNRVYTVFPLTPEVLAPVLFSESDEAVEKKLSSVKRYVEFLFLLNGIDSILSIRIKWCVSLVSRVIFYILIIDRS